MYRQYSKDRSKHLNFLSLCQNQNDRTCLQALNGGVLSFLIRREIISGAFPRNLTNVRYLREPSIESIITTGYRWRDVTVHEPRPEAILVRYRDQKERVPAPRVSTTTTRTRNCISVRIKYAQTKRTERKKEEGKRGICNIAPLEIVSFPPPPSPHSPPPQDEKESHE